MRGNANHLFVLSSALTSSPRHPLVACDPQLLALELHALVCAPESGRDFGIGHRAQQGQLFRRPGRTLIDGQVARVGVLQ